MTRAERLLDSRATVEPDDTTGTPSPDSSVESPCVGICRLDEHAICVGCGRSIDEIVEWPRANDDRRMAIRAVARCRRSDHQGEETQMAVAVKPEDFAFRTRIQVRWGDMDALAHVNNAKFFTYDETARLDYFDSLLEDDAQFWKAYGLILAHIEADFIEQLSAPAELEAGIRIARIGRSSMQTLGAMFLKGKAVAVTRSIVVWFDYGTNQTLPIPEWVRERIRAREHIAPEES